MYRRERKDARAMKKAEVIKDLVNALDPNPICANENMENFYVNTSEARGMDSIAKIKYVLTNGESRNKKFLFAGHTGSGKSTELFRLSEMLNREYTIIYLSVSEFTNIMDVTTVDIIYAMFTKLVEKCEEMQIKADKSLVDNIISYWYDEMIITRTDEKNANVDMEAEVNVSFLQLLSSKFKTFFQQSYKIKRENVEKADKSLSEFIKLFNQFLVKTQNSLETKNIMFIVDDLDKLNETNASMIFKEHAPSLISIEANVLYTFPVFMHYNPSYHDIAVSFDESLILSIIMTHQKNGTDYDIGVDTLKEIVKRRANETLFEDGVISFAIKKSGGSIRTLLNLLRTASISAGVRYDNMELSPEEEKVTMSDIQNAYRDYKNEMQRLIKKNYISYLEEIFETKDSISDDDNQIVMDLFRTSAVIEYNCDRWCDLNPAVTDYLMGIGLLKTEKVDANNANIDCFS